MPAIPRAIEIDCRRNSAVVELGAGSSGPYLPARVGMEESEFVANTLERKIRRGRFANGDQLDSEGGLMRRFSVSSNTVRRGLEMLAGQGLFTTRAGIGSFVTYDGTTIDSNLGRTGC
ncbi:MAG: hypothetical protein B7Z02_04955 [Rhodobacterales bacterium 32-67-9]|nr:MAG: hypothetical protein B7Z02_04955 [Rhodobacterales bacterium 32-67-9]